MKKIISIFLLCVSAVMVTHAQSSSTNDIGRITLKPYLLENMDMSVDSRKFLATKLAQIATENGVGGGKNQRFIITANVTTLNKDITPTAPPMVSLNLSVNLYIGDGIDGKLFASTSVTVKGVGTNETKAFNEGIKQLKANNPDVQAFMTKSKTKIVEYYKTNCEVIMKKADMKATTGNYDEAIAELLSVPEECKECFDKCVEKVKPIFDKLQAKRLSDAKNVWASSQDMEGANKVAQLLSAITPESAVYKEAEDLRNTIAQKVKELEKRDWDFKMKQYDDAVSLEKQRIDAYKAVGTAWGNGQPDTVTYKVDGWW